MKSIVALVSEARSVLCGAPGLDCLALHDVHPSGKTSRGASRSPIPKIQNEALENGPTTLLPEPQPGRSFVRRHDQKDENKKTCPRASSLLLLTHNVPRTCERK